MRVVGSEHVTLLQVEWSPPRSLTLAKWGKSLCEGLFYLPHQDISLWLGETKVLCLGWARGWLNQYHRYPEAAILRNTELRVLTAPFPLPESSAL